MQPACYGVRDLAAALERATALNWKVAWNAVPKVRLSSR
jgi:hypothetical protein